MSRVTWSRVTCTSCQQSLCQSSRLNFKDITFLQILKTHQIFPITFELQDKEVIFNISICFLAHPKQKTNKPYSKMIQEDAGNVVETRARDSTLYDKEAKLRRLKRRIEMEESFLWSLWECVHRSTESSSGLGLENSGLCPCEDHMVHRSQARDSESGKLSIRLKCDDDIQSSMSALYVISPDPGHLWWLLCWKIKCWKCFSHLRSVSVLKVQDIGFNIKDKMFVAWKLVRYESKQ